jgi:hypothetical protein
MAICLILKTLSFAHMRVLPGAGGFIKSGSIYTIEHKGGRSCGESKYHELFQPIFNQPLTPH